MVKYLRANTWPQSFCLSNFIPTFFGKNWSFYEIGALMGHLATLRSAAMTPPPIPEGNLARCIKIFFYHIVHFYIWSLLMFVGKKFWWLNLANWLIPCIQLVTEMASSWFSNEMVANSARMCSSFYYFIMHFSLFQGVCLHLDGNHGPIIHGKPSVSLTMARSGGFINIGVFLL